MAIILLCFSALALSASGLFRFTAFVKKEEKPILKEIIDEDSKKKSRSRLKYPEQMTFLRKFMDFICQVTMIVEKKYP